ncbi:hypothetical protein A2230_05945 [candidate division WOR-1 bacterium RIFOXYA2_FULL_36_21]|uniref:FdhC protein n=1 Tax=candidate division WOR-1 bacterium RIFOXYB2_FULL_36_35 TaxID=1802578 RepID=A0A1F4S7M1_UNCSA|nr:MAG: hypothetical protein A2230_05945 [candidate division WOR-1 bacterium RIFOXYA2_FULL_36_21]OGC16021.1 MAG: hypothetical protein A2282_05195 [candidate division WOR-1 bacterium RIFOXYA12_FULL_36_13]OGC16422.1 MAG: hypothetical protein A2290_02220 [candidate division WOR-1 bacterium RIFOXYB2_FULL_36_35]
MDEIDASSKNPSLVADTLSKTICVQKTNTSILKLIVLGILAGLYIGFGSAIATLVATDVFRYVGLGLGKFFVGAVFSVGFILIIVAGAELFTGNNLMLMSALDGQVPMSKVVYKWIVVYFANFIGAVFLVAVMFGSGLWKEGHFVSGVAALNIAKAKVGLAWGEAFWRGMLCNILLCLAFWMATASSSVIGKILAVFFPVTTFMALGYEHCISNMYFIPMGILLKGTSAASLSGLNLSSLTWGNMIVNNLIPVTLGNMVGGAFVVSFLYWMVYVKQ